MMRHTIIETHLDIDSSFLVKPKKQGGVYSYICVGPKLQAVLEEKFGRKGLCLKVFKRNTDCSLEEARWGQGNLVQCTKIQNLFAWTGVSPRVYAIIRLASGHYAQVTEYLSGQPGRVEGVGYRPIRGQYAIKACWDMSPRNWVGGKLVDFDFFSIEEEVWKEKLIKEAYRYASWGSRKDPYQSVDGFEMAGQRNLDGRLSVMKLDEVDFRGKTVLDLGCNLGNLCREADRRGAKRAVGIDRGEVPRLAYEFSNWQGYWNNDFIKLQLPRDKELIEEACGIGTFDIVFALSVDRQIGYAPWMAEICKETFYLEGHVPDRESTFRDRLEQDFERVDFLGMSRDHGPRPVFRCQGG